jgi:hypothetical protein
MVASITEFNLLLISSGISQPTGIAGLKGEYGNDTILRNIDTYIEQATSQRHVVTIWRCTAASMSKGLNV